MGTRVVFSGTVHPDGRPISHSTYVRGCRCQGCKQANTDYSRGYYYQDLERSRAARRISTQKYLTANPEIRCSNEARRRARKKGATGSHTNEEWVNLKRRYGNRCLFPDCQVAQLTRDHIRPLSQGGTDDIRNIQPLCRSHNSHKGKLTVDYRPNAKLSDNKEYH